VGGAWVVHRALWLCDCSFGARFACLLVGSDGVRIGMKEWHPTLLSEHHLPLCRRPQPYSRPHRRLPPPLPTPAPPGCCRRAADWGARLPRHLCPGQPAPGAGCRGLLYRPPLRRRAALEPQVWGVWGVAGVAVAVSCVLCDGCCVMGDGCAAQGLAMPLCNLRCVNGGPLNVPGNGCRMPVSVAAWPLCSPPALGSPRCVLTLSLPGACRRCLQGCAGGALCCVGAVLPVLLLPLPLNIQHP
jgi:hypothetical protein